MIYKNLEVKRRNYKKILLNILVIILLLTSIIYIYISNNSINSNTRRKINEIKKDVYLTGNPQITFFKSVYKRHTNFSIEAIEQTFNGNPTFGSRVTCQITRNSD